MPNIRVKRTAVVNVNTAIDNPIVAAVTGQKIKVVNYVLVAAAAVSATWKSAANPLSGPMPLGATLPLMVAGGDEFTSVLETNKGEALNLALSGAILVAGHLIYVLEP